jgi:ubiquinone biosynthesis monooxygenase Coq7
MPPYSPLSLQDELLAAADQSLRSLFGTHHATRPCPQATAVPSPPLPLSEAQRRESGALMRINHVGEICAQALYTAQGLVADNEDLKQHFRAAAREEMDHLAWMQHRLRELNDRPSRLNPLWYAGAFAIGAFAGKIAGKSTSLGFVAETERQVEAHLQSHLDQLGTADPTSEAILRQMQQDEGRHAAQAIAQGATPLPAPIRGLMKMAANIMTTTARYF